MRKIKYRAYDTLRERWVYYDLADLALTDVTSVAIRCESWGQWTGLKDKNGVEIYEGDLVQYGTGEKWVVAWSTRLASFIYENKVAKNLNTHEQTMDMHGVEIIGNIYENPELLMQPS